MQLAKKHKETAVLVRKITSLEPSAIKGHNDGWQLNVMHEC